MDAYASWPVKPMELCIGPAPYDSGDTLFQVKWDGVRCLAYAYQEGLRLHNRRLNARTAQYPEIVRCLSFLPPGTVLDGEIIALDADGKPSFPRVLRRDLARPAKAQMAAMGVPVQYMVFDILWYRGRDLCGLPLTARQEILADLPFTAPAVLTPGVLGQGRALFAAVEKEGLEGIVAKKCASLYRIGVRSDEWQKIKCLRETECAIGGYLEKPGGMRSLLLGVWENGELLYTGKASSGATQEQWHALHKALRPLAAPCPFLNPPAEPAAWVQPSLGIRVRFLEYTKDGVMRAPAIVRMPEL